MKYPAYKEYKYSGSEWLGVVPSQWLSKKLKYILAPKGLVRGPFGSALKKDYFSKSGIKVYEQKNAIKGDCYIGDSYIDENRYRELDRFTVKTNDVIMSCSGTIGRTVRVPVDSEKGIINQALLIIRMDNSISDRLFDYLFDSDGIKQQIIDNSIGGAMQNLVATDIFKGIRYPIPPIEEQQKIANFLNHETAKIDTLIEKQQQLIKLLKEKRQAVISHAVTKGLNRNAPMRDSGVEWLGEVPEYWGVCKLKHIISSLESGVSVNAADTPAQDDELGVLKTSCVYTRSFRVEENKTVVKEEYNRVKCPIRKGAIIISRMNTPELVGASALVETDQPNVFLPDRLWQTIFSNADQQNPKFISFFMMIKGFRNQISLAAEGASSSMQNIAKGDYLSINIAFPDIDEQNTIVRYLENRIRNLKSLEDRANEAIDLIQERRTALISAAVTGKIDVRNWKEQNKEGML